MTTATLTWSTNHGDSNPLSTFSADLQGAIKLMNQYFIALTVFSDFPWQVASFEGTTSPWQVTLKRKNGTPGRVLILGVNTPPSSTYNPQLGSMNWNSEGLRAAWFPDATTDTPANILATSGDVYTGGSTGTGLGPMYTNFNDPICTFTAWACEDGVFMRWGPPASALAYFAIGELMETAAGYSAGLSLVTSVFDNVTSYEAPGLNSAGAFQKNGATTLHFGTGWAIPSTIYTAQLRDNALKKTWYYPRSLYCAGAPGATCLSNKLRQIAIGPTSLASYEELRSEGSLLQAQFVYPAVTSGYPWLVNFKV